MTAGAHHLPALLLKVDTCTWKIDQDQPVTAEVYARLVQEVQSIAPLLDDAGRRQLAGRMDRVIAALGAGRARIDAQLRRARSGRRAVAGYANLSGPHQ